MRLYALLQKLRRAANAGQRILDFVRQHRRHRRHRSGGPAMGQLAIDFLGNRTRLQRDHHAHVGFRQGRGMNIDEMAAHARRIQRQAVFRDCIAGGVHLIDQGE